MLIAPKRASNKDKLTLDVFNGYFLADAFEGGDGAGGEAAVVAPHHDGVGGIGAHDDEVGQSGTPGKRQPSHHTL